MNTRILTLTVASAAFLGLAACNNASEADKAATDAAPAEAMAPAATDPVVGGASMSPTDTIVTNAAKASNLTTLVSAVQAAGLAETLSGTGSRSRSSRLTTPPSRRSRSRRANR